MARRKAQPPIRVNPGVVPVITANPETVADGVLKLAAVGSTIIATKFVLDTFATDRLIAWLKDHSNDVVGGVVDVWFKSMTKLFIDPVMVIPNQVKQWGMDIGHDLHGLLEQLGINIQSAHQQVLTLEEQIAADEAKIPILQYQMRVIQSQIDALITNKGFTDPADWDAKKAALQTDYWNLSHEIDRLTAEIADGTKQKQLEAAKAVFDTLAAERARWLIAVVVGVLISTTMIYAGDSIIDVIDTMLSKIGLSAVIPA
jgi:hypothetical protein